MIDEDAAIRVARARAVDNGWVFAEPISVALRRRGAGRLSTYEIESLAGYFGAKCRFTVDAQTGEILDQGYVSR